MLKFILTIFCYVISITNCFTQGLIVNSGFLILQPTAHVIITSNGNWTNNATATCNTNSWVHMSGNAIQTIQGANTTVFSNADINSTSSVFVGRDITINDNLQLTSGYFDLRAAITYLGNTSGIVTGGETETKRIRATSNAGGTDDGFGVGTIRTTRTNPTGNVANLGLDFTPTVGLGSTVFIRGHQRQTGMGNFSVYRYFDIQPTIQSNVTVNSFNYFDAELGSQAPYEADLLMFQWIQDAVLTWWQPRPKTGFNTATNYVASNTSTNILTTYKITLASSDLPLPIELINFKAECNNKQNNLMWETASEQNNDYFTVEKSFDGENFNVYTKVPSQGNSNVSQSYLAIDYTPFNGTNYYRLKQTDFDGQFTYSDILSLNCNSNNLNEDILPISPSNGSVDALLQGIPGYKYQIRLTNLLGQVITNKEIILNDYQQSINIHDSNLAIGMYYVVMLTDKKIISKPTIVTQ